MTLTVIARDSEGDIKTRTVDSMPEAESIKADMEGLGLEVEIQDADDVLTPDTVAEEPADVPETVDVPDGKPSIADDPIDWVPGHFVDEIQGVPAINRKGYAVLAANQGIAVRSEAVILAHETDFCHAAFRAKATTTDGKEYTGFGSANVDREDDAMLLNELAETRAMKRACAWATGVGMTAVEEMKGNIER